MRNLWLTVEVAPGADISSTCAEAVALAEKIELTIWFKFNGIKCLARPGDNPRGIEVDWSRAMNSGTPDRIASDRGEVPNAIELTGSPLAASPATGGSDELLGQRVLAAQQATWFSDMGRSSQEIYRHKKTGGLYGVICNATREIDGELFVVYRNMETGDRWVRPATEFNDGRFERVA